MKILRQPPYLSKDKLFFGIIFSSLYFFLYITLTAWGNIYVLLFYSEHIYSPKNIKTEE